MFGITNFAPFLIPAFIGFYLLWKLWTAPSEPARNSTTIQYEPPENLTPGECGALLEDVVEVRLITATIVDLSVKGYLTIDNTNAANARGEQSEGGDYYFHLVKSVDEWKKLKPHECQVLSAIFIPTNPLQMLTESIADVQKARGNNPLAAAQFAQIQAMMDATPALRALSEKTGDPQPSAGLSELRIHFPLHLARIRMAVFNALQSAGYYARRPDQVRLLYAASAVVIGLLVAAIGVYMGTAGMESLPWLLSGVITAIMIWAVGVVLPAKSPAGVHALGKIRGFKDFLARVEKGRLEKLDDRPELFEKYLPYAMAFGVDSRWAQAFANIAVLPPQWYSGKNANFFPVQFVDSLNSAAGQKAGEASAAPVGGAVT